MFVLKRLLLWYCLLISLSLVKAQVDVSAGTYSCYPCGRQLCGFANGGNRNTVIDPIAQGFGQNIQRDVPPLTCQEIQRLADQRQLDPELCSIYSAVTRGPDDPCQCQQRRTAFQESSTGKDCIRPAQSSECNLCGNKQKVIGDPERVLPDAMFPVSCSSLFDSQRENILSGGGGYSGRMCSDLQVLFGQHCQCVWPNQLSLVNTCIPQEDIHGRVCQSDDECCVGYCRYIHQWRTHGKVCTHRPEDSIPNGWTNPTSSEDNGSFFWSGWGKNNSGSPPSRATTVLGVVAITIFSFFIIL
mmetsp:Transcript_7740/g.11825  ORF Transcript_7740/g.11825 Transcript_7740/m.11825 type:complete len:300 (+) Transcript_7740:201-1100(+)|eukprot:CAMPEP_0178901118 /NCGR_PEP_ID=MMETSP0786-20121207/3838_1 /TAXON_ID=186022 /ORGANISM="Thalassionema frauenfeldii, Strain CCMP 1798" /LENGTH=299 /DNA_ID=CAMNT_0020572171 /DNA_START=160 /DNA_END=1059 /DNA_ORIENTATION=+